MIVLNFIWNDLRHLKKITFSIDVSIYKKNNHKIN